jgi:hypothetical protein
LLFDGAIPKESAKMKKWEFVPYCHSLKANMSGLHLQEDSPKIISTQLEVKAYVHGHQTKHSYIAEHQGFQMTPKKSLVFNPETRP